MNEAIQAAIDSYNCGDRTKLSVYMDLLYLTPRLGVQRVLDLLPSDWKNDFTSWLIEHYENDIPPEEYMSIGLSEEELNMKPDPIALVKEWIRTR